jgi:hypothetical protein
MCMTTMQPITSPYPLILTPEAPAFAEFAQMFRRRKPKERVMEISWETKRDDIRLSDLTDDSVRAEFKVLGTKSILGKLAYNAMVEGIKPYADRYPDRLIAHTRPLTASIHYIGGLSIGKGYRVFNFADKLHFDSSPYWLEENKDEDIHLLRASWSSGKIGTVFVEPWHGDMQRMVEACPSFAIPANNAFYKRAINSKEDMVKLMSENLNIMAPPGGIATFCSPQHLHFGPHRNEPFLFCNIDVFAQGAYRPKG